MVHGIVGLVLLFCMAGLDSSLLTKPSDQASTWLPWASPFVLCYSGLEWQVFAIALIALPFVLLGGSGLLLLGTGWQVVLFQLEVHLGQSPSSHFSHYCGLGWQLVVLLPSLLGWP